MSLLKHATRKINADFEDCVTMTHLGQPLEQKHINNLFQTIFHQDNKVGEAIAHARKFEQMNAELQNKINTLRIEVAQLRQHSKMTDSTTHTHE